MEDASETQTERAVSEIGAKRRFKVNLVIYLSVNALLVAAWAGLAAAGVPMRHMALNLAIYVAVMAAWGARVAISRRATRPGRVYTEEQIQREMTKFSP